MAVKDVTELRKSGELDEAYALAKKEITEDQNEWTNMSMFWVVRDMVKYRYIPSNQTEAALEGLRYMKSLLPNMIDDSGAGERAYQALYKAAMPNADKIMSASELSKTDPNQAYNEIISEVGNDASKINEVLHEDLGWIIYRYMKANAETLQSVDIRRLLRDYMSLKNKRPSLLHSMILHFAISFSKGHDDFKFLKFFLMWGIGNLRSEDYCDGYKDQGSIPSLISRICRTIVDSGETFDVEDFIGRFGSHSSDVLEHLRQAYFWKLKDLYRKGDMETLMSAFDAYASTYSCLGASHWHSEILKIANRFMTESYSSYFVPFFVKWYDKGCFSPDDWEKGTDDKGNEYQANAVRSAKKCFNIFKQVQNFRQDTASVVWIKELYAKVKSRCTDDDWSARNYATTCIWAGDIDEAISVYKRLLAHMGDRFYLWSELAGCLTDNKLRIGLLLKSKRLEKNEDFLGDIHLSLADACLKEGAIEKAKNELISYAKHRAEKGWRLSDLYKSLQKTADESTKTNREINENELISSAEEFVFSDYEWKNFVITDRWSHDGAERCKISDGGKLSFSIETKRFPLLKNAKAGDVIGMKCSIVEKQVPDPKYPSSRNHFITKYNVTPFILKKIIAEPWSLLPLKYGVVDYINKEKHVIHVITQESKQTFFTCKDKSISVDSFVKFREYTETRNGETRTIIVNVESCDRKEALGYMKSRVVVVDDVNPAKKLFHVVLGPRLVSDIVRFDQTDLRPSIGQFLKITYCIKKNKEGKKHIKFLDIQETSEVCGSVTKEISGRLELKYKDDYDDNPGLPDFAFISDYYVHRNILRKYDITEDCDVTAKMVLGGDDKWKVYELILGAS